MVKNEAVLVYFAGRYLISLIVSLLISKRDYLQIILTTFSFIFVFFSFPFFPSPPFLSFSQINVVHARPRKNYRGENCWRGGQSLPSLPSESINFCLFSVSRVHALSYHPTCNYGNRFRFTREKIDIFQNVPSPGVLETRMAN